jgi:hypothetical protein
MSTLIGRFTSAADERMFIQTLFSDLEGHEPGDISVRIFEFDGRTLLATIFTTDAVEPATKRPGLKIALGFALSDHLYLSDSRLLRVLVDQLWDLLNDTFATSLPQNGARQLIEHFLLEEDSAVLSAIEQRLQQASHIVSAMKPGRFGGLGRTLRRWKWRLTRAAKPAPKYLLVFDDHQRTAINAAIDVLVCEPIGRARRAREGDDFEKSSGRAEVVIRYLDFGRGGVRQSAVVRRRGLNYVALY